MKTKRHIAVILMVLMVLVLMPGISIQAKSKCNHKKYHMGNKNKSNLYQQGIKV